ncbi:MAG: aspartate aminotransferase family protein [Candidatus Sungbacteria bacterium]|nr:aspartate aminotransferase family protein [Candidatus Sungbacteria bacterium]
MPLEEKRIVELDDATRSIEYDGVPLSGDLSMQERLEIYRKLQERKRRKRAKKFPGPKTRKLLEKAKEVYATNSASSRIIPVRGNGSFVIDPDGFRFFDFHCDAGVNNLGRGNDTVQNALKKQLRTHNEFSEHHNAPSPLALELAEILAEQSPVAKPAKVFFSNSGAEANEAARKLCLAYRYRRGEKKRRKALYFSNGFAGRTAGVLAATSSRPEVQRDPFWTHCDEENSIYLPYPRDGESWVQWSRAFEKIPLEEIDRVLIEVPCQGEGGIIPISEESLCSLFCGCRDQGILIISDCVQTGMGRTGTLFGADCFSWFKPDILTMGKALGGGLPIGATIFRSDIDWLPGEHANTFGGGPLVMSAALASYVEIKKLLASGAVGHLESKMKSWLISFCEFPIVTDFRGRGAMWAVDFISAEARDRIKRVGEECVEKTGCGLRLLSTGRTAIRLMPPLNTDLAMFSDVMGILRGVLEAVNEEMK